MNKKRKTESEADSRFVLKTEYPLAEKDEQGHCMERMRGLQDEALKLWRELKKKKK